MAVSSATLFVASPRYSSPSCILPPGATRTTPEPAGPGLPEQAPSVYATHASAGVACAARLRRARRARPARAATGDRTSRRGGASRRQRPRGCARRRGTRARRSACSGSRRARPRRRASRRPSPGRARAGPCSVASIQGIALSYHAPPVLCSRAEMTATPHARVPSCSSSSTASASARSAPTTPSASRRRPRSTSLFAALPARPHRDERPGRRPAARADGQQRGRPPQLRRGPHRDDGHLAHRQRGRTTGRSREPGRSPRSSRKAKDAGGRLHLLGLVSDGGVHSSLVAPRRAHRPRPAAPASRSSSTRSSTGATCSRGRRRGTSRQVESELAGGAGRIGTVAGRYWAMDRDNRWERVERAYQAIVERRGAARDDRARRHRSVATPPARPTSSSSRSSSATTTASRPGGRGPPLQLPPRPRARAHARPRASPPSTRFARAGRARPVRGALRLHDDVRRDLRPSDRVPQGDVREHLPGGHRARRADAVPLRRDREVRARDLLLQRRARGAVRGRGPQDAPVAEGRRDVRPEAAR